MNIAILTFQGFNEIDSLVAFRMLKWLDKSDWNIKICCPEIEVISMGGLVIRDFAPMGEKDEFVENAVNNIAPYL